MRTWWGRVLAITVLSLVGVTSACGDDGSGSGGATESPTAAPTTGTAGSSETAASGDRCALVSAEDLSSWTGAAFTVEADGDDACTGVADEYGPYAVVWSFKQSRGSLAEDVQDESFGQQQKPVDLGGGTRGVILQGDVSGTRVVSLVAPLGPEVLVVEVMNNDGTPRLSFQELSAVATKVAEQYV